MGLNETGKCKVPGEGTTHPTLVSATRLRGCHRDRFVPIDRHRPIPLARYASDAVINRLPLTRRTYLDRRTTSADRFASAIDENGTCVDVTKAFSHCRCKAADYSTATSLC